MDLENKKATLSLIAINAIVYIVVQELIMGGTNSIQLIEAGGLFAPCIATGEWYRLFTSMFLHGGIVHIFNNMLCIFILGGFLEESIGSLRYLSIYLCGGAIGNFIVYVIDCMTYIMTGKYVVTVGASTCVFAILGAILVFSVTKKEKVKMLSTKKILFALIMALAPGICAKEVSFIGHLGGVLGGTVVAFVNTWTMKKE